MHDGGDRSSRESGNFADISRHVSGPEGQRDREGSAAAADRRLAESRDKLVDAGILSPISINDGKPQGDENLQYAKAGKVLNDGGESRRRGGAGKQSEPEPINVDGTGGVGDFAKVVGGKTVQYAADLLDFVGSHGEAVAGAGKMLREDLIKHGRATLNCYSQGVPACEKTLADAAQDPDPRVRRGNVKALFLADPRNLMNQARRDLPPGSVPDNEDRPLPKNYHITRYNAPGDSVVNPSGELGRDLEGIKHHRWEENYAPVVRAFAAKQQRQR